VSFDAEIKLKDGDGMRWRKHLVAGLRTRTEVLLLLVSKYTAQLLFKQIGEFSLHAACTLSSHTERERGDLTMDTRMHERLDRRTSGKEAAMVNAGCPSIVSSTLAS
jgi:hypothetical protein